MSVYYSDSRPMRGERRSYRTADGQWRSAPSHSTLTARKAAAAEAYGEDLVTWLEEYTGDFAFVLDVRSRFISSGKLSEKQAAAMAKCKANDERFNREREEKRSTQDNAQRSSTPVPTGRTTLDVTVLSSTWKPTDFGHALKLRCSVDGTEATVVYGNAPTALIEETRELLLERLNAKPEPTRGADGLCVECFEIECTCGEDNETVWVHDEHIANELRSKKLSLTATFKPSDNNPGFGFFSRAKATVLPS